MCAMAAPALIPLIISAATTAIGTALSVAQQSQQAAQQQAGLNYQAAMARNAATAAEYQAQAAEQAGEVEEDKLRRKIASMIGTQQARLASQGSDLLGTPIDLLADTAGLGEEEVLGLRYKVQRDAWMHRVQAGNSLGQAGLYSWQASSVDPSIGIAKTVLGGMTDIVGKGMSLFGPSVSPATQAGSKNAQPKNY